jgi:hypothetical protein
MKDNVVWQASTTDLLVDLITDAVKPKVPVLVRGLTKPVVKSANKYASKVIPDKVDKFINDAIVLGNAGEWDKAAKSIGKAGDTLVDIPNLDDAHEEALFVSVAQAIVNGVKAWIENKKK